MYIIKFKVNDGMHQLVLPQCELYYDGEVNSDTTKVLETIKNIIDKHFQEKIDKQLVNDLKDELKEQIQGKGYNFEFIED